MTFDTLAHVKRPPAHPDCERCKFDSDAEVRPRKRAPSKLPPMVHPEGEPVVGAQIDGVSADDVVPAKKRGRPKIGGGFDKATWQREYKRKKRAEAKKAAQRGGVGG
jgi:hypothetical protein